MKLKEYMIENGITINELSKITGINRITISDIVNGKRKAQIKTLIRICKALNCSCSEIED